DERAEADVASVDVDADRAADAEIGVGLHDADRQAVRVDEALDVAPADAALHADRLGDRREGDHAVERPHVEVQAARARGLPAHAEVTAHTGTGLSWVTSLTICCSAFISAPVRCLP